MAEISYVYADSTNRDVTMYPSGNVYTLHLTNPLHSITQVDLVAAMVPNTMYNLTNGSNVVTFNDLTVSIPPGYYSSYGLAQALANASGFIFCIDFIDSEGKYIISSNVAIFNFEAKTTEIQRMLGLDAGSHTSFWSTLDPVYAIDPTYSGRSILKSQRIIDLSTNEYVFLDVEELRTTSVLDAKKLIRGTTEGTTIRNTFGMIPLDVAAGTFKNYKETTDYNQYIIFKSPIPKIDRLTIRWIDRNGIPLNFQGFEHNAFTLRVHTEYRDPPPPTPPLQDIQIQRIVDALQHAPPPPKPPAEKRAFGRWVLILLVIFVSIIWFFYSRFRHLVPESHSLPHRHGVVP